MAGSAMRRRSTTLVVLALLACVLVACGSAGSDKAGGITARTTLRMANHAQHDFFATLFTDEVRRLSKGRIRIELIPGTPDNDPADVSVRRARQVRDGSYDLGVVEAPAWDSLGVRSFEPLETPFLITDQSLFSAVLSGPLAGRMLDGLRSAHVVGLSLVLNYLQHPVADRGPLLRPADFQGKRIIVPVSPISDAVFSALGAIPVHLNFDREMQSLERHTIDGQEMPAYARPNVWLTANVTLAATALTVVANQQRFDKLSDQQQRILREAAAIAARRAAGVLANDPEVGLIEHHCQRGHVVFAGGADLAAIEQALRPVYAQLDSDPQVKATIDAIRQLKRRTPPDPAPKVPASCSRMPATAHGRVRDPSFLDGTYRWRITRAGARKVGADPHDPTIGTVFTMTLRGGHALMEGSGGSHDRSTYKIIGNTIAFDAFGYTSTFTFKRRADGTLDLTAVLPMDKGDRLVTSSSPWTRIGPPVRKTP